MEGRQRSERINLVICLVVFILLLGIIVWVLFDKLTYTYAEMVGDFQDDVSYVMLGDDEMSVDSLEPAVQPFELSGFPRLYMRYNTGYLEYPEDIRKYRFYDDTDDLLYTITVVGDTGVLTVMIEDGFDRIPLLYRKL